MRERTLPFGWYPSTDGEIREMLAGRAGTAGSGSTRAGIVPHAGWAFCGTMIADVVASIPGDTETVAVLGGHNPPGGRLIRYGEDAWRFPSAVLQRDGELAAAAEDARDGSLPVSPEYGADNTVEVVLAMVAHMRPDVRWVAWRVPADERALDFGEDLAAAAEETRRRLVVLGSTDLTHYGPDYGFAPPESRKDPVAWVERRDRRILEALADFDGSGALDLASREHSSCSAGAAAAAMEFAGRTGCDPGRIIRYATSREVRAASSFVGYGTIVWEPSGRR